MATTNHRQRWHARVAIRIPRDGGPDIESNATRRLERIESVEESRILGLDGIEPALAATVAQFEVAVVTTTARERAEVERLLNAPSWAERVEAVEPAP